MQQRWGVIRGSPGHLLAQMRPSGSIISLLLLATAVEARGSSPSRALVRQERWLMHTRVAIGLLDPLPAQEQEALFDQAFAPFRLVEEQMNEWRPESALSRINAGAGGPALPAPPELCELLRTARLGAQRTRGLFDPTWAALRGLWRFDQGRPQLPDPEALAERCPLVRWRELFIEPAAIEPGKAGGCRVRLGRAGMALGLGGLAKGWGVDRAVAVLRARGQRNFYVQAGGDLFLAGGEGRAPWQVGIRHPRGPPDATFAKVEVRDAALSTSGDYEHFFELGGTRYHHIIDPSTCLPAVASRSATVVAKTATEAEILSKATFIVGGQPALELAHSLGAAAVLVDGQNRLHLSPALRGKVQLLAPLQDAARNP